MCGGQRGGSCLPRTPPRWGIAKQIQLEEGGEKKSWSKELPNMCQLMSYRLVAAASARCALGGTCFPVPSGREQGWVKPRAGVQRSPRSGSTGHTGALQRATSPGTRYPALAEGRQEGMLC